MKKVLSNVILGMLLFCANAAVANSIADISVAINEEKTDVAVIIDLNAQNGTKVKCMFENENGEIIFTDNITVQNKRRRKFDLSKLDRGIYTLKLEDDRRLEEVILFVDNNKVSITEVEKTVTYKPTIIQNDQTVDLHMLAMDSKVSIEVIDNKGRVMYKKWYNDQNVISQRFNIEKLEAGIYDLNVYYNDELFNEKISR